MSDTGPSHDPTRDTVLRNELPVLSFLQPGEKSPCIYNGVALDIELSTSSATYDMFLKKPNSRREYSIFHQGAKVLDAAIDFHCAIPSFDDMNDMVGCEYLEVPFVGTLVEKYPPSSPTVLTDESVRESLRGIGKEVYVRILDEIQEIVNVIKKSTTHEVRHIRSMGLSSDTWDSIFKDLLVAHEYHEKRRGLWYKTYRPIKK